LPVNRTGETVPEPYRIRPGTRAICTYAVQSAG